MLTLDLHTLPQKYTRLVKPLREIAKQQAPAFTLYEPNYELLFTLAGKYAGIANFIVVGRGGSISGFTAIFEGLAALKTTKHVYKLDTIDPDYTNFLRMRCRPDDTLVIVISKSGNTIDVLENLFSFQEYRKIICTENNEGALKKICDNKELEYVEHPPIGGRFSTGTECGLLPASLIYVDITSIIAGMKSMRAQCAPTVPIESNPALRLAASLYLADKDGFSEVYAPIYNRALFGSAELWTQLMHETSSKERTGQTFLFMHAPECQHHSNQKFFDGPRRMIGLFTRIEHPENECTLSLDGQAGTIKVSDLYLADIHGAKLSESMKSEWRGVQLAADNARIPNATITLDVLNPGTLGEITAFWEYVAIYSAWLRCKEPFDQPGVEESKRIARQERKRHH